MTERATVAVITRTKDRTVLLKRAIESVLAQSYPHWRMVIVNDGGDPAPVEQLVGRFASETEGRIRIVHNVASLGMHGASAVGFSHIEGDLVAIHDDDDSWAPEFLAVSVTTLQRVQADFPSIRGVTTYCNRIIEHVKGNLINIDDVEPFSGWVPQGLLSLDRMLAGNFLPPISFLFERAAFNALGDRYELIPYLGDWDFLIRFLTRFDIYMVPQYLAFYHWRVGADSDFGNSIIAELERHRFYRQLLLNKWLREDLTNGRFGVGAYANLRGHFETLFENERKLSR